MSHLGQVSEALFPFPCRPRSNGPKFRQKSSHSYGKTYIFGVLCFFSLRCVQDGPRGAQDRPMTAQEAPKRAPRRPKRAPILPQVSAKSSHSYRKAYIFAIFAKTRFPSQCRAGLMALSFGKKSSHSYGKTYIFNINCFSGLRCV